MSAPRPEKEPQDLAAEQDERELEEAFGEPPAESLLRAFREASPAPPEEPPEEPTVEPGPRASDPAREGESARAFRWGQPPRWSKILLAVAAVMMLVGAGLELSGGDGDAGSRGSAGVETVDGGAPPNTLVAGGGESDPGTATVGEPAEGEAQGSLSPFFLKGGFGFFLGFAMGYALRAFFKLALLVCGVFALGLTALAYTGLVEIDWTTMGGYFDAFVERVRAEAGDFRTFLTGSLPSAGMAALGLVAGFRRR